jgi:hypothetical protein
VEVESVWEQLDADSGCCAVQRGNLGEVRERRKGGAAAIRRFQSFEYDVRSDVKVM